MNVPYGVVGAIQNSEKPGHRVKVVDDTDNTGGYVILEWWNGSEGPNDGGAFDSWVENHAWLKRFVEEAGWEIEWLA